jgi:hypothetical protein
LQALGYIAARNGDRATLDGIIANVAAVGIGGYPQDEQLQAVLLAESERLRGDAAAAAKRLAPLAAQARASVAVHSALLRALRGSGDARGAMVQAQWLSAHRGRAYVDRVGEDTLQGIDVADTTLALLDQAELARASGDAAAARVSRDTFLRAWSQAGLPPEIAKRAAALR